MIFEVDRFTAPEQLQAFQARQADILTTAKILGLDGRNGEDPALLNGGSAFALHGLDTGGTSGKPFDVDALVPLAMYRRIAREIGFTAATGTFSNGCIYGAIHPRTAGVPLPVEVISKVDPTTELGGVHYTGQPNATAVEGPGGVLIADAIVAARFKALQSKRLKDKIQLLKAHVVATYTKHPITNNEEWHTVVGHAAAAVTAYKDKGLYASWVRQLVDAGFEHPAFVHSMQRTTGTGVITDDTVYV
jgi:hypothetical protein